MTTDRLREWTRCIEEVKHDVLRMHHHRSAWERVSVMLIDNAELPDSYWWEFMFETYAMSQASAVRRQADRRRDVDSLLRLIMDIGKGASTITKEWWIETHWRPTHRVETWEAERQWNEHFAGDTGSHLDPAIPKKDACALVSAAANVTRYVNQHIAHASAAPNEPVLPLELREVHAAIDTVDRLFRYYSALLTGAMWLTTTPIEQEDFYGPFRSAWMRSGFEPER